MNTRYLEPVPKKKNILKIRKIRTFLKLTIDLFSFFINFSLSKEFDKVKEIIMVAILKNIILIKTH
jgi:hypothetical protein